MKKNLLRALLVASASLYAGTQQEGHGLQDLLEDIKYYQTTNTRFHAGNLYEHSLWVAITINEWFEHGEGWTHGLTAHDRKLATLGGLLHDIGKGGDLACTYYTKPDHPERGQKYLLGKENYVLCSNKIFDFKKLFEKLGLSENDKKVVSILVGAHHMFGDLLQNLATVDLSVVQDDALRPYLDTFKKRLKTVAKRADYKGPIDTRLIKLVLLVCVADIKGAQPCCCNHAFAVGDCKVATSPAIVHTAATDKFEEFAYATRGKMLKKIIENFKG